MSDAVVVRAGVDAGHQLEENLSSASAHLTSVDAFREASRLHEAGDFSAAETLFRDAVRRDPRNALLLMALVKQ
jgi:thioredoxin-like negative regulator of GroEL